MTHTIEYHCPSHGTIRETVAEGQRNTAVRYGFDCCGTPVTATEVTTPAAVTTT